MQVSRIGLPSQTSNSEFEVIKKKISNPASFGPGIWYIIHRMARNATTQDKKLQFKEFIENIITNLPCTTCIEHATSYYQSKPLDQFWNMKENGQDVGLFRWSWEFHNTVNNRLKKPVVNWENAKKLFSDEDGVCTSDCGGENTSGSKEEIQRQVERQSRGPVYSSSIPVSMIREDPLQRFIPKNIIRPNSMEKSKTIKFRNA